jgi:CAAX prenyl protease-like protein
MPESPDFGPAQPWQTCVVPFAVFLAAAFLEPTPSDGGLPAILGIPVAAYPLIYTLRVAAAVAAIACFWPSIRAWMGRPSWWSPLVGLALVVPWIVLTNLQRLAGWTGTAGERSGFDPFAHFADAPALAWAFLAVRFVGLVAVVPVVEELFLRGFLMRWVIREEFWKIPFGTLTFASAAACMTYAAVTHPAEAVAAVVWFATVSGIAAATRRPIDAILAHAATNLALGGHVVTHGEWWLW